MFHSINTINCCLFEVLTMLADWVINTKWKYFVNVGSTLSSNIHCNVDPLYYVEANPNSLVAPCLTVGDIVNVISSLSNSSTGFDKMIASILINISLQ